MYLKNWEYEKGKIYVYHLLVPHENFPVWKSYSTKSTAQIKNLYVRIEDNLEIDNFELNFNKLYETPATTVIEKIINGTKMTHEDWLILCDYLLLQYVRTPAYYHWVSDWGRESVEGIISSTIHSLFEELKTKKAHSQPTRNEVSDLLPIAIDIHDDPHDDTQSLLEVQTVVGKNLWLFSIKNILSENSIVRKAMHELKWSIVTAPSGESWPACDAPVIIQNKNSKNRSVLLKHIAGIDMIVVFPVSPTISLLGTTKRVLPWRFEADIVLSKQIKISIVGNASLYVYNSWMDPEIQEIRDRTIDKELFVFNCNEYASWYSRYQKDEAPFLVKRY